MTEQQLLEHSFNVTRGHGGGHEMSRLEFLAEYIFDFTTYDSEIGELFASKALEACAAISAGTTFDYIKDADDYRWYMLMVNMPFFAGRLEWGTSIRGAWWVHEEQTLESCGIWRENEQLLELKFNRDEWASFIAALVTFAAPPTDQVGGTREAG